MNNCVHKLVCEGTKTLVACEGQRIISMLFLGCDPSCSPDSLLLAQNSPSRLGGPAREFQGPPPQHCDYRYTALCIPVLFDFIFFNGY